MAGKEIEEMYKLINKMDNISKEDARNYKDQLTHLGDSMEKILLFARINELSE